jgi:ornithine cyclodeaminase
VSLTVTAVLDLAEIQSLLDVTRLVEEIEKGFVLYSEGRVRVPPVGFLHFDEPPGDVHIKYGSIEGGEHWVLKVASGFYENPILGLPPSDGVILVFSQKTGELRLVLHDRCWLTDMRTAAAGAVAARHLAPSRVSSIGIVGTGVQARMQLKMLHGVVSCGRCMIWGRDPAKASAMVDELEDDPAIRAWGLELRPADSIDDLASECNLIVTTTSARAPLLFAEQIRPGTHVTAMGSDDEGKQELDSKLLARADRVVADSRVQCSQYGECVHAIREGLLDPADVVELGAVIAHPERGRTSDNQVTIADLTGVAVQDIQIARMIAQAHREEAP